MATPPRQKVSFRSDSPFSAEQSTFIILKYGELKSTAAETGFWDQVSPQEPKESPAAGPVPEGYWQLHQDCFFAPPSSCLPGQKSILWNEKIVGTWDTLGIKIPKPPYISSLKMVGFVHFSNFLIPSEKYYKLQSCWITLYHNSRLFYGYPSPCTVEWIDWLSWSVR